MAIEEIILREDEEFITLNIFLKITNIISTGGEAKHYLSTNEVLINGEKEIRRGRKLYRNDTVKCEDRSFVIK